jgi:hypothetical protein
VLSIAPQTTVTLGSGLFGFIAELSKAPSTRNRVPAGMNLGSARS